MILQSNISVNILCHQTKWTENESMKRHWAILIKQIGKRNLVNVTKFKKGKLKTLNARKFF
jgi:hypothetical protein